MAVDFGLIKGVLCDLDGVLYVGDRPIRGAVEAVTRLRELNLPCRFTTNTTTCSLKALLEKLVGMGLPVVDKELFGVIRAAQEYLRQKGQPSCHLLLTEGPAGDFAEFPISDTKPDVVLIGDVGKTWDYELISRVFEMVMGGAEMVALHKGRYWQTETGLRVDIGAFVAGLEYVTDQAATVIGKPSESFFRLALEDLASPPEEVVMVGDDLFGDIEGAQKAGMKGILVRTGKFREKTVRESSVEPDLIIDSIADLPGLFLSAGRM